jgi:hypothetical protein
MTAISTTRADQVLTEARQVQVSRVLLTVFLGFFWAIGWLAGKACLGLVVGAVSVRRGWRDGYGYVPLPGQPPR